jgi:alpha-beta hydrolase superfamily lysophospholipase
MVDDMIELTRLARAEMPGRPLALLGHSMGSFAAQLYLLETSADLSALVLCGTAAQDKLLESLLAGGGPVTLEALNAAFEPARTTFDWLSRDEMQVDDYIADPLCGFTLTEASMQSLFALGSGARRDSRLADVSRELPILLLSGEVDPVVGPAQAFARALIQSYEDAGLREIEHRVYTGARHELFNETNRDEVERDLIDWLDREMAD